MTIDNRIQLRSRLNMASTAMQTAYELVTLGLPEDSNGFPLIADARLRKAAVLLDNTADICVRLGLHAIEEFTDLKNDDGTCMNQSLAHIHDRILSLADELLLPLGDRISNDPLIALRSTQAEKAIEDGAEDLESLATDLGTSLSKGEIA